MTKDGTPRAGDAATAWSFLTDAEQAARRQRLNFSGIDAVHAFHDELVSGDPSLHFLGHFRRRHLAGVPRPRAASLGAGEGHLERALLGMGWRFEALVGMELNEALVRHAAERVRELPGGEAVSYRVADLNRLELPKASLDLAIFFHSLHHVSAVEACLATVSRALRPGGRLLVIDYFGPDRLQRPRSTLDRCDALLSLIPERLRVDLARSTRKQAVVKTRCANIPVAQVIAMDPSEAVRSGSSSGCSRPRRAWRSWRSVRSAGRSSSRSSRKSPGTSCRTIPSRRRPCSSRWAASGCCSPTARSRRTSGSWCSSGRERARRAPSARLRLLPRW